LRSGLFAVLAERAWKPNLLVPVQHSSDLPCAFLPPTSCSSECPLTGYKLSQN